jgi:uncharacterized membrane protein
MDLLIAGVAVWSVVHLFPSISSKRRDALQEGMGENTYRGVFALVIVGSIVMMVVGWKSAIPSVVYAPPLVGSPVVTALILIAFILFVSAQAPTNIKRFVHHPQLTSVVVWAAAHLLANGDSRSLTLFGTLGVWAILEIVFINRRDGAHEKPAPFPIKADAITVVIAAVAFAIVLYFHQRLFGVAPIA